MSRTDRLENALVAVGVPDTRCGMCGTCAKPLAVLCLEVLDQLEDDVTLGDREEIRVVHPLTGAEKGKKLARFDLIPPGPLWQVAEMYGVGATKYDDRNWERGNDWSLSFAAMMRHAWAFWAGENDDPENGLPHLAAVVFHALALMQYRDDHPTLDDRPA